MSLLPVQDWSLHQLKRHGPALARQESALSAPTYCYDLGDDRQGDLLGRFSRDIQPDGGIDPAEMVVVVTRSEEHTSELQSRENLVCRLLLEKKKKQIYLLVLLLNKTKQNTYK